MTTKTNTTLKNQTVEAIELDEHGREEVTHNSYDVRDVTIHEPDHLEMGIYDTQVTGVITWQGEHHLVEKWFRGKDQIRVATLRVDTAPWFWTGDVVGYEPGVS